MEKRGKRSRRTTFLAGFIIRQQLNIHTKAHPYCHGPGFSFILVFHVFFWVCVVSRPSSVLVFLRSSFPPHLHCTCFISPAMFPVFFKASAPTLFLVFSQSLTPTCVSPSHSTCASSSSSSVFSSVFVESSVVFP